MAYTGFQLRKCDDIVFFIKSNPEPDTMLNTDNGLRANEIRKCDFDVFAYKVIMSKIL